MQLKETFKDLKDVQSAIIALQSMGYTYQGLTSTLPVAAGASGSVIFHPESYRAQYMNIYLNRKTKTFMIQSLTREDLYVVPERIK